MAFHLGPRAQKIVRIAGFVVFGLVTFVFALQMSLPYERAKDRAVELLADKGWDLTVGEVERGWIPGRVYLHSAKLTSRPSKPDEIPTIIFIKDLKADVAFLPMLGGNFTVDLDANIANGKLSAKFEAPLSFGKGTYNVKLDGKDLDSDRLPMLQYASQPTKGNLSISADLSLTVEPNKAGTKVGVNWQKLEGELEVACPSNCVYGDGKTKLKMKVKNKNQSEFAKDGIEFGTIKIDSMLAQIEAKNGKITLTKLDVKSTDGELKGEFTMDLQPEVADSGVAGCLSYKGSDALLKRDDKSFNAITLIGGALGPDKLFHVRLSEKWRDVKKVGAICGGASTSMDDPGGTNPPSPMGRRPNLAVQPDEAAHPPVTPPITPQPPPIVPPPVAAQPTPAQTGVNPEAPGSGSAFGSGSAGSDHAVPEGSAAPAPGP